MSADRGEHTSEGRGPREVSEGGTSGELRRVQRAGRAAEGRGATEGVTTATDLIAQGASGLHPIDDIAGARTAARENGWRTVELDTSAGTDKAHFLDVCRKAFDLPDWFGDNWDALADSLTDVDDTPGTVVLWHAAGTLEAPVRETAAEIFADRAQQATTRGLTAFLVLVGDDVNAGRTMNDL